MSRKNELLRGLRYKQETFSLPEARELNDLLQAELREAFRERDVMTIVCIHAVTLYLAFDLSREKP